MTPLQDASSAYPKLRHPHASLSSTSTAASSGHPAIPPQNDELLRAIWRRLRRMILALLFLAGLIWLIPKISPALTALTISLVITVLLNQVVTVLENRDINRIVAILLVYSLLILVAVVLLKLLAPVISDEIQSLSAAVETKEPMAMIQELKQKLAKSIPLLQIEAIDQRLGAKLEGVLMASLQGAFSFLLALVSAFANAIIIAFMVFFLLKDGRRIKKALIAIVPNPYFEMSLILADKISRQLSRYIRGQIIVSAAVATMSVLALYLLKVPYFFAIGVLAGVANVIPYFGPVVGAVPAVIVGVISAESYNAAIPIIIAFAAIQLTENILISPFVVSRSVDLHPLAVIIVILIGGSLAGIWGMLLAVPVTSVAKVTVQHISWGMRNYRLRS